MKRSFVLLVLAFVLVTCKNEKDEAPSRNIYTDKQQAVYGATQTWIVIRAYETGELLDVEEITNGKAFYTFESNKEIPNNKLSVARVYIMDYDGQQNIYSNVINGIDVGSIAFYPTDEVPTEYVTPGTEIGTYPLRVTSVPSAYAYSLSDKFGRVNGAPSFGGGLLSGNMSIREGADKQIITLGTSDKPMYAVIPNAQQNVSVDLSYSDFLDFDKYVTVKFPESEFSYATVTAYESAGKQTGWAIYNNFDFGFWTPKTEFTLGFLDQFPVYSTQASLSDDFSYYKRGQAPTSIDYVGSDKFTITDKSLKNYAATSSQNYDFRMVSYGYYPSGNNLQVSVTYLDGTPEAKHNDPFTPDLIQQFSIQMEKVTHQASYFYVKGRTWQQFLDVQMGNKPTPFEFESAYVTVR